MYKSVQHYDRIQRRKFKQAKTSYVRLLKLFTICTLLLIAAIKIGFSYADYSTRPCEARKTGQVSSYEFMTTSLCQPTNGLKR